MYIWKIILEIYRSKTTSLHCPSLAKYYRVFVFGTVDDSERIPRNEGQQIEFVSCVCAHNLFVRDTYGRRRRRISVVVITRAKCWRVPNAVYGGRMRIIIIIIMIIVHYWTHIVRRRVTIVAQSHVLRCKRTSRRSLEFTSIHVHV